MGDSKNGSTTADGVNIGNVRVIKKSGFVLKGILENDKIVSGEHKQPILLEWEASES